jgi:hypothetical protein
MDFSLPKMAQFYIGLILALAFIAQSCIPFGYMPKFGTGKIFAMTICHGVDQSTLWVDEHMKPVKDLPSKDSHDKPCVFASVSSKNLSTQTFLFQQTEILTYEEYVVRDDHRIYVSLTPHSYFSQGPPTDTLIV